MTDLFHSQKYDPIEAQVEDTLEGYMARKYKSLGNDFLLEDGIHSDTCSLIAFDVAFSLLQAGRSPTIGSIRGVEIRRGNWIGNKPLQPKRYNGRIEFGGHVVCICDNEAWDPMVSSDPIPVKEYLEMAFINSKVEFEQARLSTDYIRDRLKEEMGRT